MRAPDRIDLYTHTDRLAELNQSGTLGEKVRYLHRLICADHPFVDRLAIAIFDPMNGMLKTLTYSCEQGSPLRRYQFSLAEAGSLDEIRQLGQPRVVNDLSIFAQGQHQHTRSISSGAYASSYTVPIVQDGEFYGFIFFNSCKKNVFTESVLNDIDISSRVLMMLVVAEVSNVRTLSATIRSALQMTHSRDPETGDHLKRMAAYSRLIAIELADEFDFDDIYIENLTLFAPLHDLGKISIPDSILLKPGSLSESEYEIMKTHAMKGKEMIDRLLKNFRLDKIAQISMLQNIAEYHHEAVDGSGYPEGLMGDAIPIEARIVTVADIFDALTSLRPYKKAWDNSTAFEHLGQLSGIKLDHRCVNALLNNQQAITNIQHSVPDLQ